MKEGKFENYSAFALIMAMAVGLWLWSCTFSGLYSAEGALFIKIIACLLSLAASIDLTMYKCPQWFDMATPEPLPMVVTTISTPRERKPRRRRKADTMQAPTLWDQVPTTPPVAPSPSVQPSASKPVAAPRQVEGANHAAPTSQDQEAFNRLVDGVMWQTDVLTSTPSNVWHHYKTTTPQWLEHLQTNGFTLHHRRDNKMQDILLTSDALRCKITCVSGHINVMFFKSAADLSANLGATLAWLADRS